MHFVIDALGISKPGGGRTSVLLQLRSVFELDTENFYTVVVESREEAFAKFPNVDQRVFQVRNRFAAHACAQVVIPAIAHSRKAALVHHTKHLCAALSPCPFVVTMNDMTTLRLPWSQSWIDVSYYRVVQRSMVRRASLVLTPSQDAKDDVVYYCGVDPSKVRVIPYAPSVIFQPDGDRRTDVAVRERYGVQGKYILFVGILALKKNLPTLVHAFGILKRTKSYSGKLVIVGREYPQSKEKTVRGLVKEIGLEQDVIFTGPVPDEHLPAFYRGADLFAFPSVHEGFGIVVLEAMACGVPVVASSSSSLPEVVADAGLLVPSFCDAESWADALGQILSDAKLSRDLIERGLRRAKEFSWEKVGKATIESYLSVTQQSSLRRLAENRTS